MIIEGQVIIIRPSLYNRGPSWAEGLMFLYSHDSLEAAFFMIIFYFSPKMPTNENFDEAWSDFDLMMRTASDYSECFWLLVVLLIIWVVFDKSKINIQLKTTRYFSCLQRDYYLVISELTWVLQTPRNFPDNQNRFWLLTSVLNQVQFWYPRLILIIKAGSDIQSWFW